MKVHEYQAKELLKAAGVAVPAGIVVTTPEEAAAAYDSAGRRPDRRQGAGPRRGARQGDRHRPRGRPRRGARDRQRPQAPPRGDGQGRPARPLGRGGRRPRPRACSARRWSPTRPGPEGQAISKVLVTVGHDIARELYLGLAVDRDLQCPVLMASTEGGVEIEKVAHETPEKIHREPIDVGLGLADFQARKVCQALGLKGETAKKGEALPQGLRPPLPRHGRLARRDQPADRDRGGRRPGARLQAQLRRQRPVPPPRRRRACSTSAEEDPNELRAGKSGPELRQPRRQHRLPGQRRRAGDEHDGPDQVPRRRAGQLPRRRRRREQGPGPRRRSASCSARPTSRPSWSTSSAGS